MAEPTYYEVRCPNCNTSFPPETKRCIHCGGPLGGGMRGWIAVARGGGPSPAEEEQAEAELPFQRGRNIMWVVTAVIALVLSMLRACAER
jgi:hypothetical protein